MGQPTIHCDPDQLEARRRELQSIRDGIADWDRHNPMSRLIGSAGHPDVERQLHDFMSGWNEGMSALHDSLDGAVRTLTGIVNAYRKADRSVVASVDAEGTRPVAAVRPPS